MKIGYARISTSGQDLESQVTQLETLGVTPERVYTDVGLSGSNRSRPGLREALAAVRTGDTLCVTKLDRLARSLSDAQAILSELHSRGVTVSIGGTVHDPDDPMSRLLVNVLAMVAEFERDLIRQRTREGMALAKKKGRLKGKQPKLTARQEKAMLTLHDQGEHSVAEICEMYQISRATFYRARDRQRAKG